MRIKRAVLMAVLVVAVAALAVPLVGVGARTSSAGSATAAAKARSLAAQATTQQPSVEAQDVCARADGGRQSIHPSRSSR